MISRTVQTVWKRSPVFRAKRSGASEHNGCVRAGYLRQSAGLVVQARHQLKQPFVGHAVEALRLPVRFSSCHDATVVGDRFCPRDHHLVASLGERGKTDFDRIFGTIDRPPVDADVALTEKPVNSFPDQPAAGPGTFPLDRSSRSAHLTRHLLGNLSSLCCTLRSLARPSREDGEKTSQPETDATCDLGALRPKFGRALRRRPVELKRGALRGLQYVIGIRGTARPDPVTTVSPVRKIMRSIAIVEKFSPSLRGNWWRSYSAGRSFYSRTICANCCVMIHLTALLLGCGQSPGSPNGIIWAYSEKIK